MFLEDFPKTLFFKITIVAPAGPRFFCAPAYIRSNFEKSNCLENISLLISQTLGIFDD